MALWALSLAALAVPTDTPTFTTTPTVTLTPTYGEGALGGSPLTAVGGTGGYSMQITYTAGADAFNGGLLTIFFPAGFDAPNASNFYAQPLQQGQVAGYVFDAATRAVAVNLSNLPANSSIIFLYGYNASGFRVNATQDSLITAYAYPQSLTLGAGGAVQPPLLVPVVTATPTITLTPTPTWTQTALGSYTPTPTSTITLTFTITPTFTISQTFTISPTYTPIGPEEAGTVYSYPNPYDMKKFDKVTFRFPSDPDARVTVFNLAGEPVRELSSDEINGPQGWAIWAGIDGNMRRVSGGMYYVRIRGKNTLIRRFTVFN